MDRGGKQSILKRIWQWLDLPSVIGIALIFVFALWFVRHYGLAIS